MNSPLIGPERRTMRRELASAPDAQVLQVLRLVDAMADRGEVDSLLAPLRERLRVLRPARRLRFSRLLFMPLNPVIVPVNLWRQDQPLLPRTAIPPITAVIRHALPAQVEAVELGLAAAVPPEAAALGKLIWPESAKMLRQVQMPPTWQQAGLRPSDFTPLVRAVAACLQAAPAFDALMDPSLDAEFLDARLTAMLSRAEADGATAWGMVLTILLQQFPQAKAPARAAALKRADKAMRAAAETAQAQSLNWVEACTTIPGLGNVREAAAAAHRQVTILENCFQDGPQRRRATDLATALRASLSARLEAGIQLHLLAPLRAIQETADTGTLDRMEGNARALRQLDLALRRLDGQAGTALLRDAADAVMTRTGLAPIERARLIEILQGGPEAAAVLAKLSRSGSGR